MIEFKELQVQSPKYLILSTVETTMIRLDCLESRLKVLLSFQVGLGSQITFQWVPRSLQWTLRWDSLPLVY